MKHRLNVIWSARKPIFIGGDMQYYRGVAVFENDNIDATLCDIYQWNERACEDYGEMAGRFDIHGAWCGEPHDLMNGSTPFLMPSEFWLYVVNAQDRANKHNTPQPNEIPVRQRKQRKRSSKHYTKAEIDYIKSALALGSPKPRTIARKLKRSVSGIYQIRHALRKQAGGVKHHAGQKTENQG
jgi:hypothetical protein